MKRSALLEERALERQLRQAARLTTEREREEEATALTVMATVREARAYATMAEPPLKVTQALARHDPGEVLKNAPLKRRAFLIVNSKSGPNSDSALKIREIAERLASYGLGVDAVVKLKKSQASRDARRAAKKGYPLVIAAGGDGTVAAVAKGLIGSETTLGIIPLGTYNNTAHSLGVPTDIEDACALIAAGNARWIDVGEVQATGRKKPVPFLEMGAVGLAGALAPVGQHLEKGRWEEAKETMPLMLEMQPTHATVTMDHQGPGLTARTLLVVVANGPRAGAGIMVEPSARMDDGMLDVHIYDKLDQAALAARFVANAGNLAQTTTKSHAREILIETAEPLPVVADSKVIGITPARFRVRPAALRVIAGNGPGLLRPLTDAYMDAVKAAAHGVRPKVEETPRALTAEPEAIASRALSTLMPMGAQLMASTKGARSVVLPSALALVGWTLAGIAIKRRR